MGNEGKPLQSICTEKTLNQCTEEETLQIKTTKAPVCEALYIPQTGDIVLVTMAEYNELLEEEKKYDDLIQNIKDANDSGDQTRIARSKDQMAAFLEAELKKAGLANGVKHDKMSKLHTAKKFDIEKQNLIEVVRLQGKKLSFLPGRFLKRLYKQNKALPFTAAAKDAYRFTAFKTRNISNHSYKLEQAAKKREDAKKPELKTKNGIFSKEKFQQAAKDLGEKLGSFKWEAIPPQNRQFKASELANIVAPGLGARDKNKYVKEIFDNFDNWIEEANKNLKKEYNDRKDRQKKLVELLLPQSGEKKKDDKFDESDFGKFQVEVEYIWGESEEVEHQNLVINIGSLEWETFEKNLDSNRKNWAAKVNQATMPEYIFNASGEAQFMRYSHGVTVSGGFNPVNLSLGIKGEAKAEVSLVEGKARAHWQLPSSKGFEAMVQSNAAGRIYEWSIVNDINLSISTFETAKTFLLPAAAQQAGKVIKSWKNYTHDKFNYALRVVGHADDRGSDAYNQNLSEQRAQSTYEFMTCDVDAWYKRFASKEWGEREIKIMFYATYGVKNDKARLSSTFWKDAIKSYQIDRIQSGDFGDEPQYIGQDKPGCDVMNNKPRYAGMPWDGKIGTRTPTEQQTLKALIQHYMVKTSGGKFMLPEYFHLDESIGRGEKDLAVKKSGDVADNRRVTYLIYRRDIKKGEKPEEPPMISLGYMLIDLEIFITGMVGANAVLSAELGFAGIGGDAMLKGGKSGEAKKLDERSEKQKTDKQNSDKKKWEAKEFEYDPTLDGFDGTLDAFAGAQATVGCAGTLKWKAPDLKPLLKSPNPLAKPDKPTLVCKGEESALEFLMNNDIPAGKFIEFATTGYAATISAGIGISGRFQVSFDRGRGKFVCKAHAKATLGLGAGGAFEFAVTAKHMYVFVIFVYKQLNDHNFNYMEFFDKDAFEYFTALTFKLLKSGNFLTASYTAFGAASMKLLANAQDLYNEWKNSEDLETLADNLAKNINDHDEFQIRIMPPEVKGRILHILCHTNIGDWKLRAIPFTNWNVVPTFQFDDDKNKEAAVIKILNTIASEREYIEIQERMTNKILSVDETTRDKEKKDNLIQAKSDLSWLLDGDMKTRYNEWYTKLPKVAPKIQ